MSKEKAYILYQMGKEVCAVDITRKYSIKSNNINNIEVANL